MQFVNIYVHADSSIIETDNIWHYKHILQYIVISYRHYFHIGFWCVGENNLDTEVANIYSELTNLSITCDSTRIIKLDI
jgi:hypothetical protein